MLAFGAAGFAVILLVLYLIGRSARSKRERDKAAGRTGGRIGTEA